MPIPALEKLAEAYEQTVSKAEEKRIVHLAVQVLKTRAKRESLG